MTYYEYHAVVYQDYEELAYQGVICSSSYIDAMKEVVGYFGDDEIKTISIEAWVEDDVVLIMSAEALKELKEKNCI